MYLLERAYIQDSLVRLRSEQRSAKISAAGAGHECIAAGSSIRLLPVCQCRSRLNIVQDQRSSTSACWWLRCEEYRLLQAHYRTERDEGHFQKEFGKIKHVYVSVYNACQGLLMRLDLRLMRGSTAVASLFSSLRSAKTSPNRSVAVTVSLHHSYHASRYHTKVPKRVGRRRARSRRQRETSCPLLTRHHPAVFLLAHLHC